LARACRHVGPRLWNALPPNATTAISLRAPVKTWELDGNGPTWYRGDLSSSPASLTSAAMTFDSQRGVMVLFGAGPYDGSNLSETVVGVSIGPDGDAEPTAFPVPLASAAFFPLL